VRKEGRQDNLARVDEPIQAPSALPAVDSHPLTDEYFQVRGATDAALDVSSDQERYSALLLKYALSFSKAGESQILTLLSQSWGGLGYILPRLALCALAKATNAPELQKMAANEITFRPTKPSSVSDISDLDLRARLHEFDFSLAGGERIYSWNLPAASEMPSVVVALGNHQRLGEIEPMMREFVRRGYGFMAYDHPGYGRSSGEPSEQGFYQALDAAVDCLERRFDVPRSDIILYGNSFGTTVCVDVAARRSDFRGVVLVGALSSVAEGLRDRLRNMNMPSEIFDISESMQNLFSSKSKIAGIKSPLLIFHGTKDSSIPFEQAQNLFELATGTAHKRLIAVLGAGHADLFAKASNRIFQEMENSFL